MLSKKIVKYIQSLSHKKFRDEEGVFIAEGPKVVSEFLHSSTTPCSLICAEKNWLLENAVLLKKVAADAIFETDEHWLKSISLLKTPNKVVGVFKKKVETKKVDLREKISLMLDDLQDPGNMGTIIRIADWFAIENIICSHNCVECYNPKVVQSTMGSLARVNVQYTELPAFIKEHKRPEVYATALSGDSVFAMPPLKEGIILIGNESQGIHEDILQLAGHRITIPRFGQAESLNAAVAGGIILSHLIQGK